MQSIKAELLRSSDKLPEMSDDQLDDLCQLICKGGILKRYQPNFFALRGQEMLAVSPHKEKVHASINALRKMEAEQETSTNGKPIVVVPVGLGDTEALWARIRAHV